MKKHYFYPASPFVRAGILITKEQQANLRAYCKKHKVPLTYTIRLAIDNFLK